MLTGDDLRQFAVDGYLVVPGVVDEGLLAAADEEIDELVADAPGTVGVQHHFPPVTRLPRCDDVLRRSAALSIAEQLVAPLPLDHRFDHIQVATTVPPWSHVPGGPHIDGHGPGQEPPGSFTLLAGVALTDQTAPQTGSLWVWPGSHHAHVRLFHERGTRVLQDVGGHVGFVDASLPGGAPVEVRLRRGDLVLAHFLLGHNQGGNTAPWTRRTIYYRLAVPGHAERWERTFLDPWTEYAPVRRVA